MVEEVSREAFLVRVQENGDYLAEQLRALSQELGLGEVRGRGLLLALELKGAVSSQIVEAALRRGLLVNAPRPTAIRFMPALNVTREEIDQMIGILRETIRSVI